MFSRRFLTSFAFAVLLGALVFACVHSPTPLRGLFVRAKGGFYHDGRFADSRAVDDLVEFLKSL